MNKKGVIKMIVILIILIILFLFAAFYFIGRQKEVGEQEIVQEPQTPNQQAESIENNQQPVQEQTPATIPTGGITGDIETSGTTSMPSSGGSGSGGGGGGGTTPDDIGDNDSEPPEEPEENTTLPPECVYERNSKLPQCETE